MRMNWLIAIVVGCLTAGLVQGQPPVITSFQGNGIVTWTSTLNTNATYRVEWGPSLDKPWQQTFQSLCQIEAHSNTIFQARVPMFYRVVAMTNPMPTGMVLVDAGDFQMGDNYQEGIAEERPVHTNFVSAFWIDRFEVPKAKWDTVKEWGWDHGYPDLPEGDAGWHLTNEVNETGYPTGQSNQPAVNINWYFCVKWCNARSEMDGLSPVYFTTAARTSVYREAQIDITSNCVDWSANGYRLPTEAEWEKASRGGLMGHHFPWNSYGGSYIDHIDGSKGNYWGSQDPFDQGTTPIGYFNGGQSPSGIDTANGFGLYDMSGNVAEWCWDWGAVYSANYQSDPLGPSSGTERILRGGSWWGDPIVDNEARCASRLSAEPQATFPHIGFRTVRRP